MNDHLHHDFETRSEVMIDEVGLYNYLTHPSTEVLMMAWAMNDSAVRLWEPHVSPQMPAELQEALEDPFVEKTAWNAAFEKGVHRHVLGVDIPADEWLDPSINARYISLPGGLEDAGEVLQIGEEVAKMQEGKDLIKLFCEPVEVGGGSGLFGPIPTTWNNWKTHPDKWARFGEYCRQDVVAERFILKKIIRWAPPASERRAWELDQRINERGMPADMELVAGATKVVVIERARLERRLLELTGLPNPNSVPQLMPWARERGYIFNAMGKAFVKRALAGEGELTPECREALLLRLQTSKSSVHKLDALRMNAAADGRLRHQFVFMGAGATGRFSGTGVQIQNLPRPTKEVEPKTDRAIELLRAADHATIAKEFSSPLEVVTSCLRPMFRAPAGTKFIVADLNAIENRMLAWLSRSPAMLSVYAEGRCPYIDFATALYGKTYEELWHEYKVLKDGTRRTMAKPAVLGCWAGDTLVLSERGWVHIVDVQKTDSLWDGVEWVSHDGVVPQGSKLTIKFFGQRVTSDHRIMTVENEWREAWEILQNTEYARQAFNSGCGAWLASTREAAPGSITNANAQGVGLSKTSYDPISNSESQNHVFHAQMRAYERRKAAFTFALTPLANWWTGLQTATTPSSRGAESTDTLGTRDGGSSASLETFTTSSDTPLPSPMSNKRSSTSIASTTTGTTPKGTSASYPARSTTGIKIASDSLNGTEKNSQLPSSETDSAHNTEMQEQWAARFDEEYQRFKSSRKQHSVEVPTFDVLNAGPRQRFMVWTQMGPLLSHNCGYQLSGGEETIDENGDAVQTGLLKYANDMGVKMSAEEAGRAVELFRGKYPEVKQYWRDLEDAALASVRNPGHRYPVGQVTFLCTGKSMLRILLPSGRALHYLFPEIVEKEITFTDKKTGKPKTIVKDTLTFAGKDQETRQWVRKSTYGGHLTENLCQAISRDILLAGMMRAEAAGFEIVGHVHDEIITLVDEDSPLAHQDLEQAMATVPEWAAAGESRTMRDGEVWSGDENEPFAATTWDALPLGAEGYEDDHYRKG